MKLIITKFEDHCEIAVKDNSGATLHAFSMKDYDSARSFCLGFFCAQNILSGLIQLIPCSFEIED